MPRMKIKFAVKSDALLMGNMEGVIARGSAVVKMQRKAIFALDSSRVEAGDIAIVELALGTCRTMYAAERALRGNA